MKALLAGAAAAEVAVDKLPGLPSRLQPAQLSGRLISAALVGMIAARRMSPASPALPCPGVTSASGGTDGTPLPAAAGQPWAAVVTVASAVGAAAGGAWLGAQWRKFAGQRFGTDYVGAGIEDVVAGALAVLAARALPRPHTTGA